MTVLTERKQELAKSRLRLEWVEAGSLSPNPRNWRRHPDGQMAALKSVLADPEIGWAGALLFNERTGRLIDGHARQKVVDEKALVPVLIGDWSEAAERKILATLDPLANMAIADIGQLEALLKEVDLGDEVFADLRSQLDTVLEDAQRWLAQQDQATEIIEDEPPAPPDKATTQPGDLIILGEHRLLCGDAGNPADVDRLLDGQPVHLAHCDPPYGVNVEARSNNAISSGTSSYWQPNRKTNHQKFDLARHPGKAKRTTRKMRPKDRPLVNDHLRGADFDKLLHDWFKSIGRVLLPGRAFYLWAGWTNMRNYPAALEAADLFWHQLLIWLKNSPVLCRKDYMLGYEVCFYGWKSGAGHEWFGPNNARDVWEVANVPQQKMVHLTEKPVELAARAMQYSSRPGENVLDLFGGSGSTLIAAEQTGRKAFLMELDPLYCDVISQRWESFSGRKTKRA